MSTGAVIATTIWALIVVALIAILSAESRRRRHQSRVREERAARAEAISRTARVPRAPAHYDRPVAVESEPPSAGNGDVRGRAA
jgi:hypothetical protein